MNKNTKLKLGSMSDKGKVGQIVVLNRVGFSEENELYKFEQPHLFRVLSRKGDGWETIYEMESLATGEKVRIDRSNFSFFYDASSWVYAMRDERKSENSRCSVKIEELEDKNKMLTDILVKQGNKIVVITEEQKKVLEKMDIVI